MNFRSSFWPMTFGQKEEQAQWLEPALGGGEVRNSDAQEPGVV